LGQNAADLSSTTISRFKADWWDDYDRWQRRELSTRRFVYVWAAGVYFRPRIAEKKCVLMLIGADEWGRKEIVSLANGYHENTRSWRELLIERLITFGPATHHGVRRGLATGNVLLLFHRCPAKRPTRDFPMRKRARVIWRNTVGLRASSSPPVAPATAGRSSEIA